VEEEVMTRKSAAAIVLMLGGSAVLRTAQPMNAEPEVTVRIVNAGVLRGPTLVQAKAVAGSILASAGVRVRWDERGAAAPGIIVAFSTKTPSSQNPEALAAARPFTDEGIGIVIFYDRLGPALDLLLHPQYLLGHVLAHEIGHMLLRMDSHAADGLMKARWSASEIRRMEAAPMRFTPEHAELMRENLIGARALVAMRTGGRE
jgi:hypothetical protein